MLLLRQPYGNGLSDFPAGHVEVKVRRHYSGINVYPYARHFSVGIGGRFSTCSAGAERNACRSVHYLPAFGVVVGKNLQFGKADSSVVGKLHGGGVYTEEKPVVGGDVQNVAFVCTECHDNGIECLVVRFAAQGCLTCSSGIIYVLQGKYIFVVACQPVYLISLFGFNMSSR